MTKLWSKFGSKFAKNGKVRAGSSLKNYHISLYSVRRFGRYLSSSRSDLCLISDASSHIIKYFLNIRGLNMTPKIDFQCFWQSILNNSKILLCSTSTLIHYFSKFSTSTGVVCSKKGKTLLLLK